MFLHHVLISTHLGLSRIPCTDDRVSSTRTVSQRMSQLLLPLGRGQWGQQQVEGLTYIKETKTSVFVYVEGCDTRATENFQKEFHLLDKIITTNIYLVVTMCQVLC